MAQYRSSPVGRPATAAGWPGAIILDARLAGCFRLIAVAHRRMLCESSAVGRWAGCIVNALTSAVTVRAEPAGTTEAGVLHIALHVDRAAGRERNRLYQQGAFLESCQGAKVKEQKPRMRSCSVADGAAHSI